MIKQERKKIYRAQYIILNHIVADWVRAGCGAEHLPSEHTIAELLDWAKRRVEGVTK